MSSSVNFPIGCLTKEKQIKPRGGGLGITVDFAGVRSAQSAKQLQLMNHWLEPIEGEINVVDQFNNFSNVREKQC